MKRDRAQQEARVYLVTVYPTSMNPERHISTGTETGLAVGHVWKKDRGQKKKERKTYNSQYSLVVTDLTTNWPLLSLSMGERTGSRVLWELWSYVPETGSNRYIYLPDYTNNGWAGRKERGKERKKGEKRKNWRVRGERNMIKWLRWY